MFSQLLNALARAILVFTIVVFPALAAPSGPAPDAYAVLLLATVAAVFVLLEYSGPAASFLEFRHAPPFNRLRFGATALVTVAASLLLVPPASAPRWPRSIFTHWHRPVPRFLIGPMRRRTCF